MIGCVDHRVEESSVAKNTTAFIVSKEKKWLHDVSFLTRLQ
jgi:hypothetical protein